jgi:hypothetical protein
MSFIKIEGRHKLQHKVTDNNPVGLLGHKLQHKVTDNNPVGLLGTSHINQHAQEKETK